MFKFKDGIFEPKTKEKIIKDTFFGGAEKEASKKRVRAGEEAKNLIRQGTQQATGESNRLFTNAQQAGQQGFQGALDMFNQFVPQQQQAFQGGNVAAQQQILAGLPQIQNALFGNQVDFSGLQAFNPQQQDMSFLNQQLPFTQQQEQMNNAQGPIQASLAPPQNVLGGLNPTANMFR